MCTSRLWLWLFVAWFPAAAFSQHAVAADDGIEDGSEVRKWQEAAVEFPAFPRQEDLLAFYVSAATDNRFFVDGSTLSIGGDGVVRYVLVIEAAGGARNVSFEGMRCQPESGASTPRVAWTGLGRDRATTSGRRFHRWRQIAIMRRSISIISALAAASSAALTRCETPCAAVEKSIAS